jgi:hypothetical protein
MPRRSPGRRSSPAHGSRSHSTGVSPALPPDALRLVEQAEEAEADGRTARALDLYNEGLALAMQSLPRRPELKPTIEAYLRRAMKLQQPRGASDEAAAAEHALAVGDRCRVETKETDNGFARRVGTVAFAGPTVLGDGLWIGVTLDQPVTGRHDGLVSGVRYFSCPPECGVLVRSSRVERLTAPAPGRTPKRRSGTTKSNSVRRKTFGTSKSSAPTQQVRCATAAEDNHLRRRLVPQRAASPSVSSQRSVDSSTRRRDESTARSRRPGSPVRMGLSAQHSGSPPRWGSPMSRSRGKASGTEEVDGINGGASVDLRGEEIRAELEAEVSALRSELAEAEKQLREMTREREELIETLAVAQDAVAAAAPVAAAEVPTEKLSGAAASVASLRREKAIVTRERDRLKSRAGLLTSERDSLQRQLSGLQRKLARRCAAVERGQAEAQELLQLREENRSLRGGCLCLISLLGCAFAVALLCIR